MARAAARTRAPRVAWRALLASRAVTESLGVALLALALLCAVALATHAPGDAPFAHAPVANRAGLLGALLAQLLLGAVGAGSVVVVGVLVGAGVALVRGRPLPPLLSRSWLGAALLLLALATLPALAHALAPSRFGGTGGALGGWLARLERPLVSGLGALVLNAMLALQGALLVSGIATSRAIAALAAAGAGATALALAAGRRAFEGAVRVAGAGQGALTWVRIRRERRARHARVAAAREPEIAAEPAPEEAAAPGAPEAVGAPRPARGREPSIVDHRAERHAKATPRQESFTFSESGPSGPFERPDLDLFQRPPAAARSYDRESLIMNSRILEKKLRDFGVNGRVVTVHPGPVITMYEFEPASGVKVNRITNLSDDLALALRALSVRIIAPIPGKSVVGIEVPNPEREIVYIRDLLEAESFRASSSKLTLALGKDIFGNAVDADLARMPHLLVAGATGTGKSVFLNSLLCSILFRATPDELKLLLVDPKLLELSVYEGIPHLIADVVTNPKRAAAALAGIVHKMEERYQMMSALGVRSIDQFNARVTDELAAGNRTFRLKPRPGEAEGREVEFKRLPYIVVVIDELADLMVVSARDVEEALQRLAQMARAAGIHLVLATQRPSVDVLTGVIKANFPARISFQVSSRTDSRTILDQNGAEHLLGQGDMLFLPPGTSKLQRIHGAYVSEKEVAALVSFLRSQGAPRFDETLLRMKEESEAKEERGEEVDDMYDRAIAIVAETRNASISYLQRRLKVGYNRAARMIEQMEADGIVGPQDGTKPREVFTRPLELE